MGTAFYHLGNDAAGLFDEIELHPDGVCWVVGRVIQRPEPLPAEIHLQGVALDEAIAVAMCIDETYFVGPVPINVLLPRSPIPWAGLYFPRKSPTNRDVNN